MTGPTAPSDVPSTNPMDNNNMAPGSAMQSPSPSAQY
jgi:hypothetical protein